MVYRRDGNMRCIVTRDTRKSTVRNQYVDQFGSGRSRFKDREPSQCSQPSCCRIRVAAGSFVKHHGRDELIKPLAVMVPPLPSYLLVRRRQQGWRWARRQIADDGCLYVHACHFETLPEANRLVIPLAAPVGQGIRHHSLARRNMTLRVPSSRKKPKSTSRCVWGGVFGDGPLAFIVLSPVAAHAVTV